MSEEPEITQAQAVDLMHEASTRLGDKNSAPNQVGGLYWRLAKLLQYADSILDENESPEHATFLRNVHGPETGVSKVKDDSYHVDPRELISEPEAAKHLGVSPGTLKAARLHRLQNNPLRTLPHVRIGRRILYRNADIITWIKENTIYSD